LLAIAATYLLGASLGGIKYQEGKFQNSNYPNEYELKQIRKRNQKRKHKKNK
jgi:hypothetical protein